MEKLIFFASFLLTKVINRFKNLKKTDFKEILIIRIDEIGDMVLTLPVFQLIKEQYPEARITLWCKPFVKSLLKSNPHIHRVVSAKSELGPQRYELILDMRGNRSSLWYALKNRPRVRLDRGTIRFRNKFLLPEHPHDTDTNLQVIQPLFTQQLSPRPVSLHIDEESTKKASAYIKEESLGKFVVFHTTARRPLKKWKPENFVKLANFIKEQYGWAIVFAGGEADIPEVETIREQIPFSSYSFSGKGDLMDYAALVSQAQLMIGNDSGPMHIAAATGIPVIGLFGPSEPHVFAPYGTRATYIHHKLHCNPCDQIHCKYPDNPCINRISVEEVKEKLASLDL